VVRSSGMVAGIVFVSALTAVFAGSLTRYLLQDHRLRRRHAGTTGAGKSSARQ
jgi:hypothetical protein